MSRIGTDTIVDISQTANRFASTILLRTYNSTIDTKSILGLSSGLLNSHFYRLDIEGPDEEEAKAAMLEVFQKYNLSVKFF